MTEPHSRLVYSTDGGRVRPPAPAPKPRGDGGTPHAPPPADGYVRIQRERKGRGGKTVTLITGLDGAPDTLDALLRELKQVCGAWPSPHEGTCGLIELARVVSGNGQKPAHPGG